MRPLALGQHLFNAFRGYGGEAVHADGVVRTVSIVSVGESWAWSMHL
jgi:hypothetical protein